MTDLKTAIRGFAGEVVEPGHAASQEAHATRRRPPVRPGISGSEC
jgi:hypothetical protein